MVNHSKMQNSSAGIQSCFRIVREVPDSPALPNPAIHNVSDKIDPVHTQAKGGELFLLYRVHQFRH